MTADESTYFIGPDNNSDHYRLLHMVNSGGEAQLWKAEVTLDSHPEPVAVKLLKPDHARDIDQWKPRWDDQVTLLRLIDSPGVVRVHDSFECAGPHRRGEAANSGRTLCLVMNWVAGENLWDWVPKHATLADRPQALMHLGQVAAILDQLHSGGAIESRRPVFHCDLSPGNVIINADGQATLVDFGLFRMARQFDTGARGTEGYVAPEVLARGVYSPGADRYAFGALTYFVLSGGQPPPTQPAELGHALATLPGIEGRPQLQQHMQRIVAGNPEQRPAAGEWIKVLRQQASTTLQTTGSGLPPSAPLGLATARPPARTTLASYIRTHRFAAASLASIAVIVVVAGTLLVSNLVNGTTARGSSPDSQPPPSTVKTVTSIVTSPVGASTTTATTSASEQAQAGPSNSATVPLSQLEPVETEKYYDYVTGRATVNAKTYDASVIFSKIGEILTGCHAWVVYNLGRSYSRFESSIGLEDQSPTGSNYAFKIFVDDQPVPGATVGVGQLKTISADVKNVFRLKIEVSRDDVEYDCGTPVLVEPTLTRAG